MSTAEQGILLTPPEAEWVVNTAAYNSQISELARTVAQATRQVAAPYLPANFYEGVPETLADCLESREGLPDYVSASRIVRCVLDENHRRVYLPLLPDQHELLREAAEERRDLYLRTPLNLDAPSYEQELVSYQANELEALAGILDTLGGVQYPDQAQEPII